jgi:hypothetical protein
LKKYPSTFLSRCDKGNWEELWAMIGQDPDCEWIMTHTNHCKVHPHAAGSIGGNQDMEPLREINTKIHLAVDAHGMPVRVIMTDGTTAECTQADALVENIDAGYLLADNAYDSDCIIEMAAKQGIQSVIPPKKNGKSNVFMINTSIK